MLSVEKSTLAQIKPDKRIFIEILVIMAITIASIFVTGFLKYVAELPAIIYLLVEMRIRKRSFHDIGFKLKNTPHDLLTNWHLILLVVIVFQLLPLLIGKYFLPGYIEHIKKRMPALVSDMSSKAVIMIIVAVLFCAIVTLYEEIIYRSLFMERLSWFVKPPFAIAIATLIFAGMHFTNGAPSVVLFDLIGVLADGIVYSIIFHKSKNIYASWTAHFLADIVGIVLFMKMF
ncbi:MAG TPA: type II CAAX endopeptidase family protein [Caproiciproducens sp.]|nr:type II CAAX endopeptidase family protein [Caproiciproducens sp.]